MTQEDKNILLKDLCARLPYFENWIQYEGKDYIVTGYGHGRVLLLPSLVSSSVGPCPLIEEVKPYLRPMSSMTEEEAKEVCKLENYENRIICVIPNHTYHFTVGDSVIDWLNEHHFDFRNLIQCKTTKKYD